ncbi:MAG: tetratricopeptide repeat protein, partial [Parabacteroides sp.]
MKKIKPQIFGIAIVVLLLASISVSAINKKTKGIVKSEGISAFDQCKVDYFYYEGLKLKAAGKYDAAYDAFNYCLEIDSTASAVLYELSSFYAQLNHPEKSVDMLKRAVACSPDNFTFRIALATLERNQGMFGESATEYEKLVKDFPSKPELNYYLADALTQSGEIGKAINAYDALEASIGMNEALSLQKYKLYNSLNETDNAFKEMKKLADKFPLEARYKIMIGDLYLEKNDTVKALLFYKQAYAVDPANPYYTVSMANYYEAVGDKEAAETQIRSALVNKELDVDTKVGILSRYILRLQQSKKGTDSANALFKTLIEQHPEEIDLKEMYGELLAEQGKNEEARFQFQLITETTPDDATA